MGTTILHGLLAWVVGVICPQTGLDIPAVVSHSAAGELKDFSTIATAHKQCQTPGGSFRIWHKKIPQPTWKLLQSGDPLGKVGAHKGL
jgi:hypothetical protein